MDMHSKKNQERTLNSAMRRLVSEGRDGVLRAARARAVDASGFVEQIDA